MTLIGCSSPKQKVSADVPEQQESLLSAKWKPVNTAGVTFYIPPDLIEDEEESKRMMPNSTAKFYRNENIWLVFTIQSSRDDSNRFAKERDFQLEKTSIDGKPAEISTFTGTDMVNKAEGKNYVAILSIPEIQGNTKNLFMWAYSRSPEDRETVLKIFKSVKFLKQ